MKNDGGYEKLIAYIKEKQDWVLISRDTVSRISGVPMGFRPAKFTEMLRYDEHIILRGESTGGWPDIFSLYAKYCDSIKDKIQFGINFKQFRYLPEKIFDQLTPKMKLYFPDFIDRIKAYRMLDILYRKGCTKKWVKIDNKLLYASMYIKKKDINSIFNILEQQKFIYHIKQTQECRIFQDVSEDEIKREMVKHLREIQAKDESDMISVDMIQTQDPELDEFYSVDLNDIASSMRVIQQEHAKILVSLSNLSKLDKNMEASNKTFLALNTAYQRLKKEKEASDQKIQELEQKLAFIQQSLQAIEEWPGNLKIVTQELRKIKDYDHVNHKK